MPTKCMPQTEDLANASFLSQSGMCERILVVEEASDLRQLNAEVLIDAGHQVDVAEDVATAWVALQLHRYDLLVTDQFLPDASVVGLARQIHVAKIALPIIIVSKSLPTWEFPPGSLATNRQGAVPALYNREIVEPGEKCSATNGHCPGPCRASTSQGATRSNRFAGMIISLPI